MKTIRVIQWNDGPGTETRSDMTIAEAAQAMKMDATDIEAAIEEEGRCDTDTHTAWEPEYEDEEFPQAGD